MMSGECENMSKTKASVQVQTKSLLKVVRLNVIRCENTSSVFAKP